MDFSWVDSPEQRYIFRLNKAVTGGRDFEVTCRKDWSKCLFLIGSETS